VDFEDLQLITPNLTFPHRDDCVWITVSKVASPQLRYCEAISR